MRQAVSDHEAEGEAMKVAIVGSRDYRDLGAVQRYVGLLPKDTIVVSGGARGVDQTAEDAARARGLAVLIYSADWSLGRSAGFARNRVIVEAAERVVAFWDGKSRGTRYSIQLANEVGKPVEIVW